MREPGESRGEGNRGKSSGCPREKFHLYEELDELSVGVAGGSLCGVFWNYTLSLSGAFVARRRVFHQIYIRLERHPTLIHGEKFRLTDNPALLAAVHRGRPVIPVFIWSPEEEGHWGPGAASRWWLHQSLTQLDASLRERGSRLIVRRGPALPAIRALLEESGATAVYWDRRYEPAVIDRDRHLKTALREDGRIAESFNSALLFEPWTVRTKLDLNQA